MNFNSSCTIQKRVFNKGYSITWKHFHHTSFDSNNIETIVQNNEEIDSIKEENIHSNHINLNTISKKSISEIDPTKSAISTKKIIQKFEDSIRSSTFKYKGKTYSATKSDAAKINESRLDAKDDFFFGIAMVVLSLFVLLLVLKYNLFFLSLIGISILILTSTLGIISLISSFIYFIKYKRIISRYIQKTT